ncbi:MAG: flagellar basal body rod protein FlgB [Planctomycetes bacterium]|nr:flagellar basal body rod protein FlgB [Planctomycetota bacterium]MBI3843019.1 flagellar basal body rod protein FlgB [Planctomycetota bacterium]
MRIWNDNADLIAKLMDVTTLRQRVVTANLANVNTPGYRSRDVKFEELVRGFLQGQAGGGSLDLSQLPEAQVVDREDVVARGDGNTVNLEREMGELTRNALLYQTYIRLLDSDVAVMKVAVTGHA